MKPTKEKGEHSSACYGYGVSKDVVFPHECEKWYCFDGVRFELEENIASKLSYPSLELPADILALKQAASELQLIEMQKIEEELRRESIAGSVEIKGARGSRCNFVNGTFEPTDEISNGVPTYRKKGEPDTWLEMVKCKENKKQSWRWYVKPTTGKGPSSSVSFGYGVSDTIVLPQDCKKTKWHCYDDNNFVIESEITCDLVAPHSVPEHIQALVEESKKALLQEEEERVQELKRKPLKDSVIIQGATMNRSKYVNGIFEPTKETCNDMPVYRKKGDPDVWLEMVQTGDGWRWCVNISNMF